MMGLGVDAALAGVQGATTVALGVLAGFCTERAAAGVAFFCGVYVCMCMGKEGIHTGC